MTAEARTFYGHPDRERLYATTVDEAIEEYVDGSDLPEKPREDWPDTVTIARFHPMKATLDASDVLERILEELDEDYGDWETEPDKPTEKMKEAAQVFVDAILAEYRVFNLESDTRAEYSLREWRKRRGVQ